MFKQLQQSYSIIFYQLLDIKVNLSEKIQRKRERENKIGNTFFEFLANSREYGASKCNIISSMCKNCIHYVSN